MSCGYCGGLSIEGNTLAQLVNKDFRRARWRQWLGRLVDRLRRNEARVRLACFAEDRSPRTIVGRRAPVLQTVGLDKIEGSVGRCWGFDRAFMPVCSCGGERWRRVDKALREGKQLPPVKLYKLGERYYVEDGNHRVSVARYRNLPMIEAVVTELLDDEATLIEPANEPGGNR